MQLARVIGHATATVKHPSLEGWRLLIVQALGADKGDDGDPQIAVDKLGSAVGDEVMIAADGSAAREIMGAVATPVRYVVLGQIDPN